MITGSGSVSPPSPSPAPAALATASSLATDGSSGGGGGSVSAGDAAASSSPSSGSSLGASSPESLSSALGATLPESSRARRRLSEERLLERAVDVLGGARVRAQILGKLGDRVLVALGRVRCVDDAVVGPIIDNVLGAGARGRGTSGKDDQGDESDERAPGRARRSCNGLPVRPAHGVQFYRSGLSARRGLRPAR